MAPFQINSIHSSGFSDAQKKAVFGTTLDAGKVFDGDPDANIAFGLKYLNDLASRYGPEIAIQYYNTGSRPNSDRASSCQIYGQSLVNLFHNEHCFSSSQ